MHRLSIYGKITESTESTEPNRTKGLIQFSLVSSNQIELNHLIYLGPLNERIESDRVNH